MQHGGGSGAPVGGGADPLCARDRRGVEGEVALAEVAQRPVDRLLHEVAIVERRARDQRQQPREGPVRGRPIVEEEEELDLGKHCIIVAPGEVGLTQAAADLVDDDISAGRKPPTKEAGKKKRGKIATVEGEAADDADDEPKAKPAKEDAKKPGKGKKGKK